MVLGTVASSGKGLAIHPVLEVQDPESKGSDYRHGASVGTREKIRRLTLSAPPHSRLGRKRRSPASGMGSGGIRHVPGTSPDVVPVSGGPVVSLSVCPKNRTSGDLPLRARKVCGDSRAHHRSEPKGSSSIEWKLESSGGVLHVGRRHSKA